MLRRTQDQPQPGLCRSAVGVREVTDHIWLISFMHYDLGFFDDQCTRVECAPDPFSAKVSAM
jgi:putative transposase